MTQATPTSTSAPANLSAVDAGTARFGSGQAVRRLEDNLLLTGRGQYTDDVVPADQASLLFLRSPYPHARINSIDTAAALAMPGVLKIVTGADLVAAGVKPLAGVAGFKRADGSAAASVDRHVLACGEVRFVGEAVAAIVAKTMAQARDAAEAIFVDYEELPMVVHLDDATAPGAPVICDAAPDNISAEARYGDAAKVDAVFGSAAHVVKLNIVNQRVAAFSLEPRSVLGTVDADTGRLTIRMSTQMPSGVRDSVCACLGLEKAAVRVVVGDVGGGFGMKTSAYPEDVVVAYCARAIKGSVKWGSRAR